MVNSITRYALAISLAAISLLCVNSAYAQARLTAKPDRLTMAENETLSLVVRYENGDSDDAPDFSTLQSSFDILGNNRSSQYMNTNGRITRFNQWTLTLAPKSAGKALIPPLSLDGAQSRAITIQVNKAQDLPKGAKAVFLETHVSAKDVYVQEEFIVTLKLFLKENVIDINAEPFEVTNATIEELPQSQYQTTVGHSRYQVAQLRFAVTPEASGTLEIPSFLWTLRTSSAPSNRFGFNGSGRSTMHRLRTDALTINVKARPANYPNHAPWLPAKAVTIQERWSQNPPTFKVGEPITRTIEITARGLSGEQLPPLPQNVAGSDFKTYPDQPKIDSETDDQGKFGHRTESMAIVPNTAGELTLPAVTITWWDTQKDQLQTAELPAKTIIVAAGDVASQSTLSNNAVIPEAISQPATIVETQVSSGYWPWLAAGLLMMNVLQAALWWKGRGAPKSESTPPDHPATNVSAAVKAALKAARGNNATACKQAIQPLHKELLTSSPLKDAIVNLNQHLYSQNSGSWDGTSMVDALTNLNANSERNSNAVPGLYPSS